MDDPPHAVTWATALGGNDSHGKAGDPTKRWGFNGVRQWYCTGPIRMGSHRLSPPGGRWIFHAGDNKYFLTANFTLPTRATPELVLRLRRRSLGPFNMSQDRVEHEKDEDASPIPRQHGDKERPPTSDESGGEGEAEVEGDMSLDHIASQRSIPTLTLSKTRAIALVAVATGASFLNASPPM